MDMDMDIRTQLRVTQLLSVNPEWASRVFTFVATHHEFLPYLYLAPLTTGPIETESSSTNVFEEVLYCMASAGVRANFGFDQYIKMRHHFRHSFPSLDFDFRVTDHKKTYYASLISHMLNNSLTPDTLTHEKFVSCNFKNVKGIGQTTISMVNAKYNDEHSVMPLTDRGIKKAIEKLYGKKTKKELTELSTTWIDKQVAVGMLLGIFNYTIP